MIQARTFEDNVQQNNLTGSGRSARWSWVVAILFALVPVVFTAAGSAAAQILQLSDVLSTLAIAAAAVLSAVVGLAVMARSKQRLTNFGLRRPTGLRGVVWLLPAAATIVIATATQAAGFDWTRWLAYGALVIAVALNEEFWFRGLILTALRAHGTAAAVYGSAGLFGVLHLANLAGGEDMASSMLQLVFAVVFGIAAAQLTILTRSLWPAITWHVLWNFVNLLSGNGPTPIALMGVAGSVAVIIGYIVALRRRIRYLGQSS